jgi:L-ectoine synthase
MGRGAAEWRKPARWAECTDGGGMIVRSLEDVTGTDRDVNGDGWRSRRLLLASDGMGFSLHDTTVEAGAELELEYRHHLEACYLVSGEAEITDLGTGERHQLRPGMVYALDQHDRHTLRVLSELRLVCVFNPALTGAERHVGGGYEPAET